MKKKNMTIEDLAEIIQRKFAVVHKGLLNLERSIRTMTEKIEKILN